MKQFFITGSSSGIGRALAQATLDRGYKVCGISRRKTIEHPNYRHLPYDLSSYENYHLINFNVNHDAEEVILVNNAGWLGEVKPVAKMAPENIEKAFQINTIAPAILCRMFLEQVKEQQRTVVNISSGAGKYPVRSWSTYCASKAAIDLFTQVLVLDHPEVRAWSIAPGIVDTEMQGEIREHDQSDFPEVERFRQYKESGELTPPAEVAEKLLQIIENPAKAPDIVFSLRDIKL